MEAARTTCRQPHAQSTSSSHRGSFGCSTGSLWQQTSPSSFAPQRTSVPEGGKANAASQGWRCAPSCTGSAPGLGSSSGERRGTQGKVRPPHNVTTGPRTDKACSLSQSPAWSCSGREHCDSPPGSPACPHSGSSSQLRPSGGFQPLCWVGSFLQHTQPD